MNEFALASGRTISIDGVTIRQVVIHQLDQFVQLANEIREYLRENGKDSAIEAFLKHSGATVALLRLLTDIDDNKLAHAAENPDSFLTIIIGIYQLNTAYFDERVNKDKPEPDSKRTWFDNFQFLIDRGHSNDQIMQYTYGAFLGYVEAAGRAGRLDRYFMAEAVRMAQHADAKGFEKHADSLLKDKS